MTENDVYTVVALGAVIVVAIAATRRALLAVVLDEETSRVAGIPVGALNALLAALTAVTVAAAMRVTGVLLVAALMVPGYRDGRRLATLNAKHFRRMAGLALDDWLERPKAPPK